MTTKNTVEPVLHIDPLKRGRITVKLIGTTPFYFNAMRAKAKRTLLIGGGRKTAAQRRELKHDPEAEFRDSSWPPGRPRLASPRPA